MTLHNLGELLAIRDSAARALAAAEYIAASEQAIRGARRIRDAAILEYSKAHSITETAKACGVSVATVKVVKR